ncbi:MAG: DUF1345 domain-containing protein [Rhodanobacteraceae bacterium]
MAKTPDVPADRWLWPVHVARRRPHFSTAVAIFVVLAATMTGAGFGLARGMLISFDISAAFFIAGVAWMFAHSTIASIKARVAAQDAGRWGVLWSSIMITSVAIVSLTIELGAGSRAGGLLEVVLAGASLMLSWLFLNTMFGLHYAHEYYMKEKGAAFQFPEGSDEPDYWDFMYFAFVLGMTFQVSDVQIVRKRVRRIALVHGIIAFFFDVFILALSVNIVAGKV